MSSSSVIDGIDVFHITHGFIFVFFRQRNNYIKRKINLTVNVFRKLRSQNVFNDKSDKSNIL